MSKKALLLSLLAGGISLSAGLAVATDAATAGQAVPQTERPGPSQGMRPPGGPGMARPTFEDFDRNGDGRISQQEFDATRSERISQRASEGRPMRGLAGAQSFAEIDKDGDGVISRAEFAAHQQRAMASGQRPGQGMGAGAGRPQ